MPTDLPGRLLVIAAFALAPAVCEEVVFRGVLLSSLRDRLPAWAAITLSAALFGLFHLSLYRFLGTFALGAFMGLLVWRSRSIFTSALFHLLNNTLALLLPDLLLWLTDDPEHLPPWLVPTAALVSILGLVLAMLPQARPADEAPAT